MVESNSPEDSSDNFRLETLRWIKDQCEIVVNLIQTQRDLTDEETESLRYQYKELNLRMKRERRELKRLGILPD